ncbi:MAG: type 1 glutamine amidotransferase domain-containing protein [Thermoleophilia bacterium]
MSLNGRRVAILVAQQYEDLELWYPKLRLEETGVAVVVAGLGDHSYPSKHGYPADTDAVIDDLDAADFDGVIIPGGWAPDYLRRSEAVKRFVAAVAQRGGLVAAICHGGSVLISAGVANGRRLTSVPAIKDDMVNAGAEWVDAPVVVDDALVTSRNPRDLTSFMPAVIAVLTERAQEAGRAEASARVIVDEELISMSLSADSLDYMLEMLIRMPAAKNYHEGTGITDHDLAAVLQDFVQLSDPRGALEAEAPVIADVRPSGTSWTARGNLRALHVLQGADVPGVTAA